MKIESITVKNVRGLVDFSFDPKGKNVVVSGPNASGKSALVDAIDFLFTGKISRLTGKGTGDLSLQEHGKHISSDIKNASVSASVSWEGMQYTISRQMSQPRSLIYDHNIPVEFIAALECAENGYHVLSRRELLKFIAAEDSTRAQEIQALLNLEAIEELRKLLVSSHKDTTRNAVQSDEILRSEEREVTANLGLVQFSEEGILSVINRLRATLGGHTIKTVDLNDSQKGLTPLQATGKAKVNPDLVKKDVERLSFPERIKDIIIKSEEDLKALITEVKADTELQRDLQQKELVDLGIELLGEAKHCPLCGKTWCPEDLKKHLGERRKKATHAVEVQEKAMVLARNISSQLSVMDIVLPKLLTACVELGKDKIKDNITVWQNTWIEWKSRLSNPLNKYPINSETLIWSICGPTTERNEWLSGLVKAAVEATPKTTPEQTAWDTLTRATENWKRLERARTNKRTIISQNIKAKVLVEAFDKAHKNVLGSLYEDIEKGFVDNYHTLHEHEKDSFKARIQPEGAGVKMRVDFFGKGEYPPHALHSEGHQDSMGLCLFLSLMSKLAGNQVGFTVLDDVVMSVDVDHRRSICDLLSHKYPERQFFITTHDKTWARQLENTNVVSRQNMLSFRGWTVETGPRWKREDLWTKIKESASNDDIPEAAAALRRELEEMFDEICVCLAAPVPYNGQAKYDRGELASSAIGTYGKLLRRAKDVAGQWSQLEKQKKIIDRETVFDEAKKSTNIDDWIINEMIHYNAWLQVGKGDFEPIVDAFARLRDSFKCPNCDNYLYIEPKMNAGSLRCRCGEIMWNLKK